MAYGKLLTKEVLNLTKKGFINIHASLLPQWRGAAPIQRSIMNLDKQTGISIMKINEKLDTGPICNSYPLNILENEKKLLDDVFVARAADVLFAFPAIILGLLIASVFGPGTWAVITVIVAATLPLFIRVIRSVAISIATREFVIAARVAGASPLRIMLVHLLPNVAGTAIIPPPSPTIEPNTPAANPNGINHKFSYIVS